MSRRNFLRLSAGAVAGAALLHTTHIAYAAATPSCHAIPVHDIPREAAAVADGSKLVQESWQYLLDEADNLQDRGLRAKVSGVLHNPAPTFMEQYHDQDDVQTVYQELAAAGLVEKGKATAATLFPPLADAHKSPQPFLTAPGSGYGSHHPYPGGLPVHTASNVAILRGIIKAYKDVFFYDVDSDTAVAGELLHDLAKPWVFQWQDDGSSLPEHTIAATGAHHIFSIAESIYRGLPLKVVQAQACAHEHPGSEAGAKTVAHWLQAAAILARRDPIRVGLLQPDGTLPEPIAPEGFLVHLGDHDWVLSGFAAKQTVHFLQEHAADYGLPTDGAAFNHYRNYVGGQIGYMRFYEAMAAGKNQAAKLLDELLHF
jgi:hypothetical protein